MQHDRRKWPPSAALRFLLPVSKNMGRILLGGGVTVFFAALLFASFLQSPMVGAVALTTQTPTLFDPVGEDYKKEIKEYEKELQKTLPAEVRENLEARKKYSETQLAEREEYLKHSDENLAIKETYIAEAALSPQPTWRHTRALGLVTEGTFPTFTDMKVENAWVEADGEGYIIYIAGSLKEDPDQGVIYTLHDPTFKREKFLSPTKDGPLKVKGFEKGRLVLQTEKGKDKYFDAEEKKFADTLDGKVSNHPKITTPTPTTLPDYP